MTNRDNFNKKTINEVALRVGHRCSFPSCNQPTVVKADNAKGYTILGEACHICAASPDGPRYDPSMSFEERTSADNAIWLCKKHHKIIDDNPTSYTVEILKQFKNEKEEENSKKVNGNYFFNQDIIVLNCEFNQLVENCDFKVLEVKLDSYLTSFGTDFDELILRYKCILYIYTANEKYKDSLNNYLSRFLDNPNLDSLIRIIIEHFYVDSLKLVYEALPNNDDRKKALNKYLFVEKNILESDLNKFYNVDVNKLILSNEFLNRRKIESSVDFKFLDFENEYFNIIKNTLFLCNIEEVTNEEKERISFELLENKKSIDCLDIKIKAHIYNVLLKYFLETDIDKYNSLYESFDSDFKNLNQINETYLLKEILENKADIDDIIFFCEKTNNFNLLLILLQKMPRIDALKILEERKYLLKKNSLIMYFYYKDKNIDQIIIDDFCSVFKEDLAFAILKYKNGINKEKSFDFIVKHKDYLPIDLALDFINIMLLNHRDDIIVDVLDSLSHSRDKFFFIYNTSLYINICDQHLIEYCIKVLNHIEDKINSNEFYECKARFNSSLNNYNLVREDLIKCYQLNKNNQYLNEIVRLNNYLNLFLRDDLYNDISQLHDVESLIYLAHVNNDEGNYEEVFKFYLQCYCIGEHQDYIRKYFFTHQTDIKIEISKYIQDNCNVVLESHGKTKRIILLKEYDDKFNYINDDSITVTTLKSPRFSLLKFKKINDLVIIDNIEYKIKNFDNIFFTIISEGGPLILKEPSTKVFYINEKEPITKQLSAVFTSFSENDNLDVKALMTRNHRMFTSFIVKHYFKNDYRSFYERTSKQYGIKNNQILLNKKNQLSKFIISPEVIYFLFELRDLVKIDYSNFFVSYESYSYYFQLYNDKLASLDNENEVGYMIIKDGNPYFVNYDSDYRNSEYIYWTSFREFLKKFNILPKYDNNFKEFEFLNDVNIKDCLEVSTFQAYLNNRDYIILTDDYCLQSFCNAIKAPNVGILAILAKSNLEDEKVESISRWMTDYGFNYCNKIYLKPVIEINDK